MEVSKAFFGTKCLNIFASGCSNAWQMGHNSRQGFILGQKLLLDFDAWIDLTSNVDNLPLISVALEVREHILLL